MIGYLQQRRAVLKYYFLIGNIWENVTYFTFKKEVEFSMQYIFSHFFYSFKIHTDTFYPKKYLNLILFISNLEK